jgi:hypothetical protein
MVRAAWQSEATFEKARRHLGIETQRQWSDKAFARATRRKNTPRQSLYAAPSGCIGLTAADR